MTIFKKKRKLDSNPCFLDYSKWIGPGLIALLMTLILLFNHIDTAINVKLIAIIAVLLSVITWSSFHTAFGNIIANKRYATSLRYKATLAN